jgi:hypothetical protein
MALGAKLVLSFAATLEGQLMSPVRKMIMLVLATAMIAGGCWLLYEQLTVSTVIFGWFLFAGGALVAFGVALLGEDFIAPLIARKPS